MAAPAIRGAKRGRRPTFQATGFGIAIAARYTETAGNSRAYVDFVRAQVYYTPAGCE